MEKEEDEFQFRFLFDLLIVHRSYSTHQRSILRILVSAMDGGVHGTPNSMASGSMLRSTPNSGSKIDGHAKFSSGGGGKAMGGVRVEVSKEGWLRKKGSRVNMWGERYFVLKGSYLYYFLKSVDAVNFPFKVIQLSIIFDTSL